MANPSNAHHLKYDVAIVIPTFRRPEILLRTLEGIEKLETSKTFEVIVADNDGSSEIRSAISDRSQFVSFELSYVDASNVSGPSFARNKGAELARATYLGFLDDDAYPAPDWLDVVTDRFQLHPEIGVLAGRMTAYRLEHPLEHSRQFHYERREAHYLSKKTTLEIARRYRFDTPENYYLADFFTGANAACRTSVFEHLRGFDNNIFYGQDHDLALRCLDEGWKVAYIPEMVVRHEHGRSYREVISKCFNHGSATAERVVLREKTNSFAGQWWRQLVTTFVAAIGVLKGWRSVDGSNRRIIAMIECCHLAGSSYWGLGSLFKTQNTQS